MKTCAETTKEEAKCIDFIITENQQKMISKVAEKVCDWFEKVPVLVITRGTADDEMRSIYNLLANELPRRRSNFDKRRLQILRQFDDDGKPLNKLWNDIIRDATLRDGTADESYYSVTVTDIWGGRGHDFNCKEEHANQNGGMLVIATEVPDTREWIQWIGEDRLLLLARTVRSAVARTHKHRNTAFMSMFVSMLHAPGVLVLFCPGRQAVLGDKIGQANMP